MRTLVQRITNSLLFPVGSGKRALQMRWTNNYRRDHELHYAALPRTANTDRVIRPPVIRPPLVMSIRIRTLEGAAVRRLLCLVWVPPPRRSAWVRGLGERSVRFLPARRPCRLGIGLYPSSERPCWVHIAGVAKHSVTTIHPATIAFQDLLGSNIAVFSFFVCWIIENVDEVVRDLVSY